MKQIFKKSLIRLESSKTTKRNCQLLRTFMEKNVEVSFSYD